MNTVFTLIKRYIKKVPNKNHRTEEYKKIELKNTTDGLSRSKKKKKKISEFGNRTEKLIQSTKIKKKLCKIKKA